MALFDLPLAQMRTYRPANDDPDDFDDFWHDTLADARTGDALIELVPAHTGLDLIETWDITFAGFGGHPIRAWYSVPRGTENVRGTVVEFLGYGRGRGLPHERLTWVNAGFAHLLMDTRGQGGQYGNGGDTDDPIGAGPSTPGFLTRGLGNPNDHYYRRLITDAVRAVDLVPELPGSDRTRIAVVGNSQGGGLALAVTGLHAGVGALLASVPFLCHPRRALEITDAEPWAEVTRYLAVYRDREESASHTLSYLDGVNFAKRANAPAHFGSGCGTWSAPRRQCSPPTTTTPLSVRSSSTLPTR